MKVFLALIVLLILSPTRAQQTDVVDFQRISATIDVRAKTESVEGTMRVEFMILKATDSVYLDAVKMKVSQYDDVKGIKEIGVTASEQKIWLTGNFRSNRPYTVSFQFTASPSQTMYFTGEQIWTQGQGKYTSHWLPSIDDMNDKIEFDLIIAAPSDKTVVSNGSLISKNVENEKTYWKFDMNNPMSSYLVAIAIGDFQKQQITSALGTNIELYYSSKDLLYVEPTYRYSKKIFDFLESEIGVAYPWHNYKQVPVRDFLYAGMENTTATIFSEAFVVDSTGFNDRNYVNVNAHELAHQWFGNYITETEGTHHWLQEGFATYYALLAEKEIFGADYYYWKLFQSAEQLKAMSDEGKGEALLNAKASSLTFYEKGAWALHILKEEIGEPAFKLAVQNYLKKYAFLNVSTSDFISEVRAVSGRNLAQWETDWLKQSAFQAEDAYNSLLKSSFMKEYFEVAALRGVELDAKKIPLQTALTFPNDFIGQEAIYQLANEPSSETLSLYKKAFNSNNLFVRQAIALTTEIIPKELQEEFESLLDDTSYVTNESALYSLWVNFPEKRSVYLNKMRNVEGFRDKNVRQLWLVLALVTNNFEPEQRENYVNELTHYTSNVYSFEVRERALGYVNDLQMWDTETLKHLVNASVHHSWRFRNYARQLLDSVLENEIYKAEIIKLMSNFSEKEKKLIAIKIAEE
tara:strand:+ start:105282 stop:107354 length:2073 start_codon:yes stop_codon:yes gene_type:complete